MTESNSSNTVALQGGRLPRRDWVVMPLLVLLTISAICCTSEAIAKKKLSEPAIGKDRCTVFMDLRIGVERPANCTYFERSSDGDFIKYHLNNQGYREDADLLPKAPGVFRIVMVGTSFGFGGGSSKDETIANLLPVELSQRTGRKMELYNESIPGFPGLPQNLSRRFDDVLAAKPDLILWQMTRWDIKANDMTRPEEEGAEGEAAAEPQSNVASINARHGLRGTFSALVHWPEQLVRSARSLYLGSGSASMLTHLLGQSQSQFISSSLHGPDTIVGYLKADRSELWAERDARFDAEFAEVEARARAAHVPVVLTLLPTRVQVAMVSGGDWPAMYDPYKLDNDVHLIATEHGATYLDVLPDFRDVSAPERGYRLEDGHPNANGNRMLASFLAKELTKGAVPALSAAAPPEAGQERRQ